jgi:uncharacterized protein YdhG (YjbR/CyaY superfamily)
MKMSDYKTIDEYIMNFPPETQEILEKIRQTINSAVPGATEVISYGIPTFKLNGKNVVHFGGYDTHIGFYPGAIVVNFADKLRGYKTSKGTVQFPLDKPVPYDLITEITEAAVERTATK